MSTQVAARIDLDEFKAVRDPFRALGNQWVKLADAMTATSRLERFYEVRVQPALTLRCTDEMVRDQKVAAPIVVEFLQDLFDQILDRA